MTRSAFLLAAIIAAGHVGASQAQQQTQPCDPASGSSEDCAAVERQMEPGAGEASPPSPESSAATSTTGVPDPTAHLPPNAGSGAGSGETGAAGTSAGSAGSSGSGN